MATSASEARAKASEEGCDDVLGARRANFFKRNLTRLFVIVLIIVAVAYLI